MRHRTRFAPRKPRVGSLPIHSRRVRPTVERCEDRTLLAVTYHGGPLVQNVGVQTVYFGKAWATDPELQRQADLLDGFFTSITQSTFMDLLSEYSTGNLTIGRGSFLGRDLNAGGASPSAGATISDSQIQSMLRTEITAGRLKTPDANRVIFVIPPPNVLVTDGTANSVNDFLGYHGSFIDAQGVMVYYAVIAHPDGNADIPGVTPFQQLTEVSSHELAEAVTDPGNPAGWYQDSTGEEVADLANNAEAFLNDYLIEQTFSNLHNAVIKPLGATLTDPLDLAGTGSDLNVLEGAGSTGVVATFSDGDLISAAMDFSAQIDWGDGTTSAGVISIDPNTLGQYDITGTHDYGPAEAGTKSPVSVTINDLIDDQTITTQSTAHVVEAPLTATGFTITPTKGVSFTGPVASFSDANPFGTAADFTVTIQWGDGSTSAGTVAANPGGGFLVNGTHTYTQEGTFQPSVIVVDGGALSFAKVAATVADLPLTVTPQSIAATEGSPFSGRVASFTDADPAGALGDYTATIDWGDGTTSAATITAGASGGFDVSGTHTFGGVGAAPSVTVSVLDNGGAIGTAVVPAVVTDAPLSVSGMAVNATEHTMFSGLVASFTDADPAGKAANYTATIQWGDGTTSAGTIAAGEGGGFNVLGTHTYSEEGSLTISVAVSDVGGATGSATGTMQVIDAPVVASGGYSVSALEGVPFLNQIVATFIDPAGSEALGDYSATISWGDGTSSAGTLSLNGPGFNVAGSHTYAGIGNHSILVTISHDSASNVTTQSTAVVNDAPISAGGDLITTPAGLTFRGTVASLVDVDRNTTASLFSATISWGDGSTSAGTVTAAPVPNQGYLISGVHTYRSPGLFRLVINANDSGGSSSNTTGLARVTAAPPASFDGLGTSQFAVFRPSTAQWNIAGHAQSITFGATNLADIPVPGDYNGDGQTQLAVFRPATGQWFIAGSPQPISFGATNLVDIPVPGDYDGTGRTQLAVFRPSTGQWFIGGHAQPISFGATNLFDIPVPGDYDGIGRTELAVFRPSTGQWIILNPITGTQRVVSFGATNLVDIPVPGDYDGTGRTEVAVFRPTTAQWTIVNPLTGTQRVVTYGAANLFDIPLEASIASLKKLGRVGGTKIKAASFSANPSTPGVVMAIAPSDPTTTAGSPFSRPRRSSLAVHLTALDAIDAAR